MPRSIQHVLRSGNGYVVTGSLWIECENERFFGPGRAELLERIESTGSISQAAKEMHMSYKKAWAMIASLNKQASKPMVLVKTGGKKGGGSALTKEARELIAYHRLLRKRFAAFLKKESMRLK